MDCLGLLGCGSATSRYSGHGRPHNGSKLSGPFPERHFPVQVSNGILSLRRDLVRKGDGFL
jgi:hypothetical protein